MSTSYFNNYLEKHSFVPKIGNSTLSNSSIIVVIPCFNEPDILLALESLWNCERPLSPVEIIVVANYPEGSNEPFVINHIQSLNILNKWANNHRDNLFRCYILDAPNLPKKFAGVGLARKIGMDEAIYRFSQNNMEEGIICGFDADATVDSNYLRAVESHFNLFPKSPGASIYFEHPFEDIKDPRLRNGIIQYELHLRYLVNCIRYTGFPYVFHTVGSSFAVKATAYVKQGGMNKFKAGEDFYFINKIIPLGGYTEINTTCVNPQGRISDRVPFGTGASMIKWMESDDAEFLTYQFESFAPLKNFFRNLERSYQLKEISEEHIQNEVLYTFLKKIDSEKAIEEILKNSSSFAFFTKRFYRWFNAFKIVKYLNFASTNSYVKKPIRTEAIKLISQFPDKIKSDSSEELLTIYRLWDKSGWIMGNSKQ